MTSTAAKACARSRRTGILLVHGLCGSPSELRFVANGLTRAGYDVACPELAGHGGSAELLEVSTWRDWYRSVEAAFDDLSHRCDRVVVGGLSTGAVLALMLAAERRSQVAATLLYAPTLWLDGWSIPPHARLFGLVRHKWLARLIKFPSTRNSGIKDERVRAFVRTALDNAARLGRTPAYTPGGAVLERRWLVAETLKGLARVEQPTLIVHPREDDYAGLRNAWHLQRTLPGPVDMCVLDDSYHYVTVDRQRHVVLARSLEFLERVVPVARSQPCAAASRAAA